MAPDIKIPFFLFLKLMSSETNLLAQDLWGRVLEKSIIFKIKLVVGNEEVIVIIKICLVVGCSRWNKGYTK